MTFVALAALLAGCGSGAPAPRPVEPRLPRATAQELRARVHAVEVALAASDGCAAGRASAALERTTTTLVGARRVPRAFQAPLQTAVSELAARPLPPCKPPPAPPARGEGKGHGKHGHGHGHEGGNE